MRLVIVFAYFDNTIGMQGPNLEKFQRICQIRDRRNKKIIIAADFNMTPQQMRESGMLTLTGLSIITAGDQPTCKHSHSHSQIDYLLVDTSIVSLVSEVKLLAAKTWSAHCGIEFVINCRHGSVYTLQLVKPKPIPYQKDDKGNHLQWHIEDEDWHNALEAVESIVEHLNDETKTMTAGHGSTLQNLA